ncbi:hypothetical protein [Fastidiosipila sanguinis]|uniref:Uncharacterized protein n=1 Tax=Fastidiosipila sanguinis TaxID=236753 RepID=A0A2S0KPR9_9FIRM|nr:hypothetical protein [Fastidiosipila sanguinis]AVM42999.1 hypothetical protein C5Q98_07155 [Fastidiosipila sanguinis]
MNRRFLTSSIVLIICCLFIVSCNEQHHIGESLNPENSSINNDVAESDSYDELPTPTGYKRGSLVFYYLKVDNEIYTNISEAIDLPDDVSNTEGGKVDINMLLQEQGYQKIGTVQDVMDDIPVKDMQGHGFAQGDEIYRNDNDEGNYLYVVTETPKSAYYEMAEDKKVYHVIVMRI